MVKIWQQEDLETSTLAGGQGSEIQTEFAVWVAGLRRILSNSQPWLEVISGIFPRLLCYKILIAVLVFKKKAKGFAAQISHFGKEIK